MAHDIDTTTGKAAIAYIGDTPWHKLGQPMQEGQSIEQWQKAAGMDFNINSAAVHYKSHPDNVYASDIVTGKKVLYRSDTGKSLAVVSDTYKVVQPKEVLEFYRELTEKAGFKLETAGVLREGRKYWALASMGQEAKVLDDQLKGYLLLGTACDGTMATTAMFTSVRVVCANTLGFAMNEAESGKAKNVVRVNHRSEFDEASVKAKLGIAATSWNSFMTSVDIWCGTQVDEATAKQYFDAVSSYTTAEGDVIVSKKTTETLMNLFQGGGMGSQLTTAKNTAWGLINAVTEYVDHHKGRTADGRMDRAWFGDGQIIKNLAVEKANELALV
jgi:phage/plasmid-like protein (TIGR03299 family)